MARTSQAWWTLGVLFLINAMNFYDRLIPGAINEDLKHEFALTDTQLGLIGTAFTLVYAAVGLPLGWLADRFRRTRILSVGVFVWSMLTAGSGFARSYTQLFAWRLGVGIGEASCAPAASSLIGDLFPATRRAVAMSIFMLGLPLGNAAGYAVSGVVAQRAGWQYAFFVAAIPGMICAVLAWITPEPARGQVETHNVGTRRREGSAFLLVLSIPTMWWIIASGALHNFNMYALGQFLGSFLRRFHGVDASATGLSAMAIYGLSGVPGLLIGGFLGDRVRRGRVNGRLIVASIALGISVPCMVLALMQPAGNLWAFGLLMGLGCGVMYVYYSTVYSTIQDVVEPALRGTAMALYFFAMYVGGASLGSVGCGFLSDQLTRRAALAAGVTDLTPANLAPFAAEGLHSAMFILPVFGVLLTIVLWAASRTVGKDVARLQDWLAAEATTKPERTMVGAGGKLR